MMSYGSNSIAECHKILLTNLNHIKYLQFVTDEKIESQDFEKSKQNKINVFNHSINNIRTSLEKLQAYTIKTNNETEKKIKDS